MAPLERNNQRPLGKRYVVARLGKAGGKMKYTLLDERDISLANDHIFEARLEIDKSGNGASIFAYAFCQFNKGSRNSARYLHELVWERHAAPISPGFSITHKNRITMDNRFENLQIVSHNRRRQFDQRKFDLDSVRRDIETSVKKQMEQSLYWSAIQQLPPDHVIDEPSASNRFGLKTGESCKKIFDATFQMTSYFECHFPPCIKIERKPREFSICGRCREARYCGSTCQQKDWPVHKKFCREKPRRYSPYTSSMERMSTVNKHSIFNTLHGSSER